MVHHRDDSGIDRMMSSVETGLFPLAGEMDAPFDPAGFTGQCSHPALEHPHSGGWSISRRIGILIEIRLNAAMQLIGHPRH